MALANVALTNTFDEWRSRTNQIIVALDQNDTITSQAFNKANAANVLAFNTGLGANAYANQVGAGANAYMITVQNGSNTAVGAGANNYANAVGAGANAYMITVQNGSNTAVGAGANAYTDTANAYLRTLFSGVGAGANNYANAVGAGANAYMITVQNGSNTAVGQGANAYTDTANAYLRTLFSDVGAGANTFAAATIAGANTAVGAGANNYANATFVKLSSSTQTITGNIAVTGNIADSKGDVRTLSFQQRTTSSNLSSRDSGNVIYTNAAAIYVDPNTAFQLGQCCTIINYNAVAITLVQNTGTTLRGVYPTATTGNKTIQSNGIVTFICVGANLYQVIVSA